ncbi:MAG: C10 family peptidase [Flavobacteriales bacterium]|nr:C10 family peptidase [Flavobacteriales bacterium]
MKKLVLVFCLFIPFYIIPLSLSIAQVTPLVNTTWNQGCYYNANCPTVGSGGACGRAWTGCGATAFGQVLKYYAYPVSGWNGNYCNNLAPTHCVDVGAQTYNYGMMPAALSSPNAEVAKLLYHMGIILDMAWSGSNSTSNPTASHFKRFWKYSLTARGAIKAMYSNAEWENLIINELNAGRVVVASGGAHIYLIDGYQTSPSLKFHINFGWGGLYDGYYNIHNVIAGGSNYTPSNLIIGLKPMITQIETTTDTIVTPATASTMIGYEIAATTNWNITSNQSWLTPNLSSGAAGYYSFHNGGSATVTANPGYMPRFATLTATAGSHTSSFVVKQLGIQPFLNVSTNNLTFSAAASGQNVNISTDSNWVASTSYPWISISPVSGIGNSTITINVTANGPVARTGTVLMTRGNLQQTITINQASNSSFWCIPALSISGTNGLTNVTLNTINRTSPNNEGYIHTGLSTTLKLDSIYNLSCTFVGGNAPAIWIDWNIDGDFNDANEAIMPPTGTWYPTFNSTKTLTFTVPSNAVEGTTRMRVYCKNFPNPTTGPCNTTDQGGDIEDYDIVVVDHRNIQVNPNSLTYNAGGGSQTVNVTSDSAWTATCPASWISFSTPTATGNGSTQIIATPNTGTTLPRTAIATFTRGNKFKTVSILQQGEDTLLQASIDTIFYPSIGGVYFVSVNSNVNYSITPSTSWITTDIVLATGISSFTVFAEENTNTSNRISSVIIKAGTYADTIYIVQQGAASYLSVNPDSLYYVFEGGNQTVNINTNGSWSAYISDTWISLNSNSGFGNFNLIVTADTNHTGPVRTSTVTITSGSLTQEIWIYQDGYINSNTDIITENIILYPNPASDFIHLSTDAQKLPAEFTIMDIQGRIVNHGSIENTNQPINLQDLNSGLYLIQVIEKNLNIKYLRFIKQ